MSELKLTSVLNMSGDYSGIRRTIRALSEQTVRNQIEVVVIATRAHLSSIDHSELAVFGASQVVDVESLTTGAYGWAEGCRRAQAPIVVISEDHGFPAPNWAETLIDAHASGDYYAVCPALENGNPATLTSWANFLLSFLPYFSPDQPHEVEAAAGHNTSYNRAALMADYGAELDRWLNPERVLHFDLRARGKRILLDSRTSVAHVNLSLIPSYLAISYAGGRVFGSSRALNWGWGKRLIYTAAFPLVPLIRLKRLLEALNTPQKRQKSRFWPALPLILVGLGCHALGEAVGYLLGAGDIARKYTEYELHRREYVTEADRALLTVSADARDESATRQPAAA